MGHIFIQQLQVYYLLSPIKRLPQELGKINLLLNFGKNRIRPVHIQRSKYYPIAQNLMYDLYSYHPLKMIRYRQKVTNLHLLISISLSLLNNYQSAVIQSITNYIPQSFCHLITPYSACQLSIESTRYTITQLYNHLTTQIITQYPLQYISF